MWDLAGLRVESESQKAGHPFPLRAYTPAWRPLRRTPIAPDSKQLNQVHTVSAVGDVSPAPKRRRLLPALPLELPDSRPTCNRSGRRYSCLTGGEVSKRALAGRRELGHETKNTKFELELL